MESKLLPALWRMFMNFCYDLYAGHYKHLKLYFSNRFLFKYVKINKQTQPVK